MRRNLPRYVYEKGRKGYLYFVRGNVCQRMPDFPSPDFDREYARLTAGMQPKDHRFNWITLCQSYRNSVEYAQKKPRTREDYSKVLAYFETKWGKLDPRRAERRHFIEAMEANRDTVRFANYIKQVGSVLMEHAIDKGWRADNPCLRIKSLKTPEAKQLNRQEWPATMLERFREEAPLGSRARTIFELCIGTGQRIGDVLNMRESRIEDGGIHVKQGKRGKELWVPFTASLQEALDARPALRVQPIDPFLVSDHRGRQVSYRAASHAVMQVRKEIGAEAYDIHGLRYTTIAELAGLGLSDEAIMAVSGQSKEMVAHYAGKVRQRTRARQAQEKRK